MEARDLPLGPDKPAPDTIQGGYRFPASATPVAGLIVRLDASVREGRSEKGLPP
jgi:hypothetical protein